MMILRSILCCVAMWLTLTSVHAQSFLSPQEAFQFSMSVRDPACIENCLLDVRATVASNHYLYRERFALESQINLPVLEFVNLPRGERKVDQFLNQEVEILRGDLIFQIRYSLGDKPIAETSASMTSQGCADAGLCYPPMKSPVLFNGVMFSEPLLNVDGGTDFSKKSDALSLSLLEKSLPVDEAQDLASRLAAQSLWVVLPVFFGLGLLLAFTPCTLPMLPILSGLLLGSSVAAEHSVRSRQPILLALVYVLGMALTYALLGVLAGLTGQSLVVAMQKPLVLWGFGALLALLGLVLLMGYSLQLPSGFQSWLNQKTGRLKGGRFIPVWVMGVLSALLLGPCVAPPLAGALLYIGQTGDAVLGGLALFLLALGMGLPLVLFVAGASSVLPKVGAWMNWVSAVFGFLLLAVAVWLITPVTPVRVIFGAWAFLACVVSSALFYGASGISNFRVRAWVLCRSLALLFALLALIYLMGMFSGSSSLLKPLAGMWDRPSSSAKSIAADLGDKLIFEKVRSQEVMDSIAQSTEPVMLDFYADWCVSCQEFELFTLTNTAVKQSLKGIRLMQVDVTNNTIDDQALLRRFHLFGPPAILFFPAGELESIHRVIGFQDAERFDQTLTQIRPNLGL